MPTKRGRRTKEAAEEEESAADMATSAASYEEQRRKRVLENLKHFENLGISQISKSLVKLEHKNTKSSPRPRKKFEVTEVRRSSRVRNPVSYKDGFDEIDLRSHRRRYCRIAENGREYKGRISSCEQQVHAAKKAEKLQSNLCSDNPSFVKTMVRSHVSSCFWLGLPTKFCKDNLPSKEVKMVLEDEDGVEVDAVYIGNRTGLSGGWRGFAMQHNLEDGDALVFELSEPDRFKIYIVKAIDDDVEANDEKSSDIDTKEIAQATKEEPEAKEEPVPEQPAPLKGAQRRKRRR